MKLQAKVFIWLKIENVHEANYDAFNPCDFFGNTMLGIALEYSDLVQ